MKKLFLILSTTFSFSLVFTALVAYFSPFEISGFLYFLFTFVFSLSLATCFLKPLPEFMKLVNILFFLGFWFKATLHIIFGHDFNEPAGIKPLLFINEALWSSLFFGVFLLLISNTCIVFNKRMLNSPAPAKSKSDTYSFVIVLVITFSLAALNWKLGFLRVGLPSESTVIFPFSFFLSWFLGLGSAFLIFHYARSVNFKNVILILSAATAVSLTLLSRNTLVLFFYPLIIYFYKMRRFKFKQIASLGLFVLFFGFSLLMLEGIRKDYNGLVFKPKSESKSITETISQYSEQIGKKLDSFTFTIDPYIVRQLRLLVLERWIGFEGMLVASQNESDDNFTTMLTENQKTSLNSVYQDLAHSTYPKPGQMLFYTFPGPGGTLFFAKSWTYRIIGFCFLGTLFLLSAFLIEYNLSGLSKSAISWWAAGFLTQFSLFPIHNIMIYLSYLFLVFILIMIEKRLIRGQPSM